MSIFTIHRYLSPSLALLLISKTISIMSTSNDSRSNAPDNTDFSSYNSSKLRRLDIAKDVKTINMEGYSGLQRIKVDMWKMLTKGNIIPEGPTESTPPLLNIPLKQHQQRMLYEMLVKESLNFRVSSGINCFCIGDKVGSGKSIEILSLICRKPLVNKTVPNHLIYNSGDNDSYFYSKIEGLVLEPTIEFKSNLIVVPHGIFNQWQDYITNHTKLRFIGIGRKKDISCLDFDSLTKDDAPEIVLVKSTRYNHLAKVLETKFPHTSTYKDQSLLHDIDPDDKVQKLIHLKNKILTLKHRSINNKFVDDLMNLKELLASIPLEHTKERLGGESYFEFRNIHHYKGPLFQRVFFDEANSIKIPNCQRIMGKFHWFITSSLNEILFPKSQMSYSERVHLQQIIGTTNTGIRYTGFLKNSLSENEFNSVGNFNFVQDMYLKNLDSFVKASFQLPDPIIRQIQCYTPPELNALRAIAMPDVIQALNAGDIGTAVELVGCQVVSQQTISDMVLHKLQQSLTNINTRLHQKAERLRSLEEQLEIHESNKRTAVQFQEESGIMNEEEIEQYNVSISSVKNLIRMTQASIDNFTSKRRDVQGKVDALTERISDLTTKTCPICTDNVSNTCLTPCCKNAFCFQCITMSLRFSSRCPLCRVSIQVQNLTVVAEPEEAPVEEPAAAAQLPRKMEALLHLIQSKPSGRFLVFSEYETTFNSIMQNLEDNEIPFSKLNGSTGRVTNIIQNFQKNNIRVLLLNAKYYGSGLNLQCCTDIILYHRMSSDLEKQIIGRGQRPGRTTPLIVSYLCHDSELNSP